MSSADTIARVQSVIGLSIKDIAAKARYDNTWDDALTQTVTQEYYKFLALHIIDPRMELVPSPYVDEMWHSHILHTQLYNEHTKNLFGTFLHHVPATASSERNIYRSQYNAVLDAYKNAFGVEANSRIWPQPVHDTCCGQTGCDSGTGCKSCKSNY